MAQIEKLIDLIIGHSLLYIQTGNHRNYAKVMQARESIMQQINNPPSEVATIKERKGIPTVIEWRGDRYVYDSGTSFRGGSHARPKKARRT